MRQFIAERPTLQRLLTWATMLLVVGTLLLLANTLANVEFQRGEGLGDLFANILGLFTTSAAPQPLVFPPQFWDILTASFWVLFILSILSLIFSRDSRIVVSKRLRRLIGLFLLLWLPWALYPALMANRAEEEAEETISGEAVDLVLDDFETIQLAERLEDVLLELPDYSTIRTVLVIVGILLASALLALLWRWWLYQQELKAISELPVDELRLRALETLRELRQGNVPLADLIRRCYREMVQTVHEQRGIYRERHVTPREFEQRLLNSGFPPPPVGQLTRLFEQVRYGNTNAGEREKRQAIDSLEQIVAACERLGRKGHSR